MRLYSLKKLGFLESTLINKFYSKFKYSLNKTNSKNKIY